MRTEIYFTAKTNPQTRLEIKPTNDNRLGKMPSKITNVASITRVHLNAVRYFQRLWHRLL